TDSSLQKEIRQIDRGEHLVNQPPIADFRPLAEHAIASQQFAAEKSHVVFPKFPDSRNFSRTSFSCALPTILYRVRTRHAAAINSTSRCKRYQVVCGILRNCSGAFSTKSTMTRGKLPSRKIRSAALIASDALLQRIQNRCCNKTLSKPQGSNESCPSISATK